MPNESISQDGPTRPMSSIDSDGDVALGNYWNSREDTVESTLSDEIVDDRCCCVRLCSCRCCRVKSKREKALRSYLILRERFCLFTSSMPVLVGAALSGGVFSFVKAASSNISNQCAMISIFAIFFAYGLGKLMVFKNHASHSGVSFTFVPSWIGSMWIFRYFLDSHLSEYYSRVLAEICGFSWKNFFLMLFFDIALRDNGAGAMIGLMLLFIAFIVGSIIFSDILPMHYWKLAPATRVALLNFDCDSFALPIAYVTLVLFAIITQIYPSWSMLYEYKPNYSEESGGDIGVLYEFLAAIFFTVLATLMRLIMEVVKNRRRKKKMSQSLLASQMEKSMPMTELRSSKRPLSPISSTIERNTSLDVSNPMTMSTSDRVSPLSNQQDQEVSSSDSKIQSRSISLSQRDSKQAPSSHSIENKSDSSLSAPSAEATARLSNSHSTPIKSNLAAPSDAASNDDATRDVENPTNSSNCTEIRQSVSLPIDSFPERYSEMYSSFDVSVFDTLSKHNFDVIVATMEKLLFLTGNGYFLGLVWIIFILDLIHLIAARRTVAVGLTTFTVLSVGISFFAPRNIMSFIFRTMISEKRQQRSKMRKNARKKQYLDERNKRIERGEWMCVIVIIDIYHYIRESCRFYYATRLFRKFVNHRRILMMIVTRFVVGFCWESLIFALFDDIIESSNQSSALSLSVMELWLALCILLFGAAGTHWVDSWRKRHDQYHPEEAAWVNDTLSHYYRDDIE